MTNEPPRSKLRGIYKKEDDYYYEEPAVFFSYSSLYKVTL